MRLLLGLLALLVAAALASACTRRSVPRAGDITLSQGASATLDGKPISGKASATPGAVLDLTDGTARVTLDGGASLEVRRGSSLVVQRDGADVQRGSVLVDPAERGARLTSSGTSVQVSGGRTRLDRATSLRVGTYLGAKAGVSAPGGELSLPALREVIVSPGVVPAGARPLRIDVNDSWDALLLPDAVDLDRETGIALRVTGLKPQLARASLSPLAALRFVPAAASLDPSLLPGDDLEKLVAAVIAVGGSDVKESASRVRILRQAGASWGITATDLGRKASDVLQTLDSLINALPIPGGNVTPTVPAATQPPSTGAPPATTAPPTSVEPATTPPETTAPPTEPGETTTTTTEPLPTTTTEPPPTTTTEPPPTTTTTLPLPIPTLPGGTAGSAETAAEAVGAAAAAASDLLPAGHG